MSGPDKGLLGSAVAGVFSAIKNDGKYNKKGVKLSK